MSLTAQLLAKVTAVLEKMNLWESNAKKNEELPEMETVDASSFLRVSVGGVSKKLELQKLIDASVSTTYNQFIASGELTFVDNELTVPASQWLINAVNYQKLTPTVIEIPFSATGKTRIDLIYANTSNQILKETGFETIGIAIPPTLPLNAVEVAKIVVTDSEIEPETLAITTDQLNAIQNSNSPSASNPFATAEDLETATSNASKEDKVSGVIALGTDNYTTTVPDVTALVSNYKILCSFQNSNTGASTINVNGLGVKEIRKQVDVQLVADDLLGVHWLMYDGTYFQLVGNGGGSGGGVTFDSTPTAGSTNAVTSQGIKTYVDGLVVGLWDDRGSFDASSNTFPSSGGSGASGAILKGDIWTISVAGTLGSQSVEVGDTVRALVDTPSTTPANWAIQQNNIGYVPENAANKATAMTGNTTSNIVFLSAKAVYDWAVGKFQDILVSGTNIKTINGSSILGSGDLTISGGGSSKKIQEFHTLGNRYTNLAADVWFCSSVESGLLMDNTVNIGINLESVGIASAGATVWITPLAISRQSSKLKKLFFRTTNNNVTSIRLVVFIGQSVHNSNTRINISTIHDETFSLATVDTSRVSFKEISAFTNDVTIPAGYDLCYMFVNKSGAGSKYINGMQISGYLEEI